MEDKIDVKLYEQLAKEKQALVEVIQSQDEQLSSYKELGSPEEIDAALDKSMEVVNGLDGVDVSNIKKKVETLKKYEAIGSVQEINNAIDKATQIIESYLKCGSPAEVSLALEAAGRTIDKYSKFGSPNQIQESLKLMHQYEELGSIRELDQALSILEDRIESTKCEQLAAKYNVDTQMVHKMFETVNDLSTVEKLLDEGLFSTKRSTKEKERKVGRVDESLIRRVGKAIM